MEPGQQRIQRLLANAFLVLVTFVVVVAGLEIGARLLKAPLDLHTMTSVNGDIHYPRPYVMFTGKPLAKDHNLLGYRGQLPTWPRPPGEYRIFVIGGSTVYGNDGSNFPQLLGERFAKDGVRVFNFGIVGSVSRQDFVRLVVDLTAYQPDLVLFYGGGNDLATSIDDRINYPHRFALYQLNPGLSIEPTWNDFVHMVLLNSQFLRRVFTNTISRRYNTRIHSELETYRVTPSTQMRVDAFVDNLVRMKHYCAAIGCRLVAVQQPMAYLKSPAVGDEKRHGPVDGYDQLPRAARARGVELIDWSHLFDGKNQQLFSDYIHLLPDGDRILADALYRLLLPMVREPTLAHPLELKPETYFLTGQL